MSSLKNRIWFPSRSGSMTFGTDWTKREEEIPIEKFRETYTEILGRLNETCPGVTDHPLRAHGNLAARTRRGQRSAQTLRGRSSRNRRRLSGARV